MGTLLKMSLDPGNGGIKAARPGFVVTVPAVVGIGSMELGLLTLTGGVASRAKVAVPHVVGFDHAEYLVGENVGDYGRPVERLDMGRFAGGQEIRAMTYAAWGKLLDPGRTRASIVVGLPVALLQSQEAKEATGALKKWMRKEHTFHVDGDFYIVSIEQVKVAAQPVGAFFAWGLDVNGQWVKTRDDLQTSVAVCDVGYNTLDLFVVKGGRIQPRWTQGRNLGMRRATGILGDLVLEAYDREISLSEGDSLIRKHLGKKKPMLTIPGGPTNVANLVTAALGVAQGEAVSYCENKWGRGRDFAYILLCGGGALAYEDALRKLFLHAQVLPNAVTANAEGLSKLAQRPRYLKD